MAYIAGVFSRYVLNASLTWVDESSSLLLVWLMLAVAPVGFHKGFHISCLLLVEGAPRPIRAGLGLFANACTILLFAIAGYYGALQTIIEMGSQLSSIAVSRAWFTWVLPVGSAAIVAVCVNNMLKILRLGDLPDWGERVE